MRSQLRSLYRTDDKDKKGHEYETLSLGPADVCSHIFAMKGIHTVECKKCHYGLTGIDFDDAKRICERSVEVHGKHDEQ